MMRLATLFFLLHLLLPCWATSHERHDPVIRVKHFVAGFPPAEPDRNGVYRQFVIFSTQRPFSHETSWHECVGWAYANASDGAMQEIDWNKCAHTGDDFGRAIHFKWVKTDTGRWKLHVWWMLIPNGTMFGAHPVEIEELDWVQNWGYTMQVYAGPSELDMSAGQIGDGM